MIWVVVRAVVARTQLWRLVVMVGSVVVMVFQKEQVVVMVVATIFPFVWFLCSTFSRAPPVLAQSKKIKMKINMVNPKV